MTEPVEPLTPELAADIKARFGRGESCKNCGGIHARACPRIKAMTFHPGGTLAGVEFWPDGKWSTDGIIWPEDTYQPPDDDERQV